MEEEQKLIPKAEPVSMLEPQSDVPSPRLVTEPVLAQIPLGAPGRGYWRSVGILVWLGTTSLLIPLYRWLAPDLPFWQPASLFSSTPIVLLAVVAAVTLPLALHPWLLVWSMRFAGAPTRLLRRGLRWLPYSEQPLSRLGAVVGLLTPLAAITLLGLGVMLSGQLWGLMLIAFEWALHAPDAALMFRLLSEPGCLLAHFRRDGVVLYGTSRAPARQTPARLWITGLVLGAGWMALAVSLAAPHVGWLPSILVLASWSLLFAALRARHLRRRIVRERQRRLGKEADEAREMQLSLLPAAPPPAPGVQLAALFRAAHEVSGDFYLFPSAPAGTLRLVVGDVAGKGLPSAITAALAVGFLRAGAETAPDPAALLYSSGHSLRMARSGRTLVAACAAELEPESRQLRWCNAGLPPPALLRAGQVAWLPGTGIPLASLPHVTYAAHEETLAAGDLLLFYTDGLVEATSPLGDLFGRERLAAALCRLPAACTAEEVLARLHDEVARFVGDAPPYDDLTAVALRVE
jgi:serine phosphatase RsbU (regulator of sigma subunit)